MVKISSSGTVLIYMKTDRLGTVLEPLCLQIKWVNFVQILRLFEISNSNKKETAFIQILKICFVFKNRHDTYF